VTSSDKLLYQQIHPAKLMVDFGTSFASSWLLWEAHWAYAIIVAFVPSIVITSVLMRFSDLERYRRTSLGVYVAHHMPAKVVGERVVGQLLVWVGAATHVPWLLPFGYFVIVLAWLNGLWAPYPVDQYGCSARNALSTRAISPDQAARNSSPRS
jgi:hypothetical protein